MALVCLLAAHSAALNIGSAYDNKFLTLQPTYTINDWAAAQPIVNDITKAAKAKTDGLMYCGYATTRSLRSTSTVGGYAVTPGDKLFGRIAFPDADALLSHVADSAGSVDKLVSGPASLDELQIHGPAAELAKCKDALGDAQYYTTGSGLSRIERETGAMPLPLQLLTLYTAFSLGEDAAAATALCDEIVELTASETDCLYCGWTRNGDTLCLREAFGSVVGIARHAANVEDKLAVLANGPATLEGSALHSSLANLRLWDEYITDKARSTGYASAETTRYYSEEGGFSRYDVQQSVFGFYFKR